MVSLRDTQLSLALENKNFRLKLGRPASPAVSRQVRFNQLPQMTPRKAVEYSLRGCEKSSAGYDDLLN